MTELANIMTNFIKENPKKKQNQREKAVDLYAAELLDNYISTSNSKGRDAETAEEFRKWLLNGADDWSQYSYGGCSLVYDKDIVERVCVPSYAKKYKYTDGRNWLEVQVKYLTSASNLLIRLYKTIKRNR